MLDNFTTFLKKKNKKEPVDKSKNAAKERLHLVLMQDRANVSADFLEMMKQEIVDVVKKYIDVDETDMDVKLENRINTDGTSGAPALYANIPIVGINEEKKKESEEISKAKKQEQSKVLEDEAKKVVRKTTSKRVASDKKSVTKSATVKAASEKVGTANRPVKKVRINGTSKKEVTKQINTTKE